MRYGLTRGAAISTAIHVVVLLSLILVIPRPAELPPPPDDTAMDVVFEGKAASAQKSDKQGKVAAETEADTPSDLHPAIEPPKHAPIEPPAPPPPPPPPPPKPQVTEVTKTVLSREKLVPPPPEQVAEHLKPPPPVKVEAAREPPKPPPAPKTPPFKEESLEKALETVTHQPNHTKNPKEDTHSLDNTLEQFMADQKQVKPPTHRYNAERGGAHDAGGQKHGNHTGDLTEGQRKTIGDSVRKCYSEDTAAKDYLTYSVKMTVTVDATGEARSVDYDAGVQSRAASDPAYRVFVERARDAVLDPQCAKLPLPPSLLGLPSQTLTFLFRP